MLYSGLLALAVGIVLTTGLHVFLGWPWEAGLLILAACYAAALWLFSFWRMTLDDIVTYLNRQLPELEDSCGLLLKRELHGLERLQAARVEARFRGCVLPRPLFKPLLRAVGWLGLAVAVAAALGWIGGRSFTDHAGSVTTLDHTGNAVAGSMAPQLRSVEVRVAPPAYTGRTIRSQSGLALRVEEGSTIDWTLVTSGAVDSVNFLFNDSVRWPLRPADAGGTVWRLSRTALQPGFYQVRIGKQLSALYTFELIKDEPPRITIRTPKPYVVIDYGESEKIPLVVQLKDDYGIADATVMATVSSGKGEAVKFKEQELRWGRNFAGGQTSYELAQTLDLFALGLKPGDELYFYCKARDNHGQETRTETYILSLADTAQLMSLQGITVATDVKPEFFRSERQIIIETEQLLSQKDTLAVTVFNNRSSDLGIDQKLLRLRYGKFLGEEAEEGEGLAGPGGDTASMGVFGDATKILDAYTDKHDNAEDATYFEPAIKKQLKATLSEMWNAELRLRTYQPREALPYCYKALRLLKDLQQQSRAFVAKTGVRVTPLNPGKRLTGELNAILPPKQKVVKAVGMTEEEVLRAGLALLEGMRAGMPPGDGGQELLQQVERRLGNAASARPGEFLAGYAVMRKIVDSTGGVLASDLVVAEKAIGELLPEASVVPGVRKVTADGGLSKLYFSYLNP